MNPGRGAGATTTRGGGGATLTSIRTPANGAGAGVPVSSVAAIARRVARMFTLNQPPFNSGGGESRRAQSLNVQAQARFQGARRLTVPTEEKTATGGSRLTDSSYSL